MSPDIALRSSAREKWLWRGGVILALAAMVTFVLWGQTRIVAGAVAGSAADAGHSGTCLPGREIPIIASPHIARSAAKSAVYNSSPPTSGPHFSFTTVPGVYASPIADGLTVHAMEHGHVIIHYAPSLPAASVDDLRDIARLFPADVILAPNPAVAEGVALTAWGRLDTMPDVDDGRIITFVDRLRGRYNHGWRDAADCP